MSLHLLNRDPEPAEQSVPRSTLVSLEVADDCGADVDLATARVWVRRGAAAEQLAFDAGAFQPGYDGPGSAYSQPLVGLLRVALDPTSDFASEQVVTVRVHAQNTDFFAPETLDQSYAFAVEDFTPPQLVSALAVGLRAVRATFDEPMTAADEGNEDDALNPAGYTLTRLVAPSVEAWAASVDKVSEVEFEVTFDTELSPGRRYLLTALGIEDANGNPIPVPGSSVEFVAYEPPYPAERDFCLYESLPEMNRQEDVTEDLAKLCAVLQEPTDLVLAEIDGFAEILDPDLAPEQYLDAMLADLGCTLSFVPSLSVIDKRRLLRVWTAACLIKGTERSIVDLVRFFLGVECWTDEFVDGAVMLLGESELGSDGTDGTWILGPSGSFLRFAFTVVVQQALEQWQRDRIAEIVHFLRPAHTHFMGVVEPTTPPTIDHLELGLSELGHNWLLH